MCSIYVSLKQVLAETDQLSFMVLDLFVIWPKTKHEKYIAVY